MLILTRVKIWCQHMAPSFEVTYLFCSEILSSHDCFFEPAFQIVFKQFLVLCVGGVLNFNIALKGAHYKYHTAPFIFFSAGTHSPAIFFSLLKNRSTSAFPRSQANLLRRQELAKSSAMASISEIPQVRNLLLFSFLPPFFIHNSSPSFFFILEP